ncbi:FAD-dependent oxidoreductase [Corynebacterium variabile]|uniref:FAD-dependent oxidoreductase n=1 Tax=Corynebacterium variabile TaxID=1727 RepID=UPI003A95552D
MTTSFSPETDTGVLVVGLGSFGFATVDHLPARDAPFRVTGIEQFDRGHSLGSFHGGSRMIRMSYMEGDAYVPLLRRAFELWDELEKDADIVYYVGGLYAGAPDSQNVTGALGVRPDP